MKDQEINERVAKLCGWKPTTDGGICWDSNGNPIISYPNYAESLDACREFMGQIKGEDQDRFAEEAIHLSRIAPLYEYEFWFAVMTLTPMELCECFLKLKGQWE